MIELREFLESDTKVLVKLANNENVARYLTNTFPYPYSVEDAQWWINVGSKEGIQRAILLDGQLVGSVGANPGVGERERQASVGYWIGEPYWGKGIAAQALKMLVSHIFETTEIVRVYAWLFEPNSRSARVLEKAGFEHEATIIKSLYKHGMYFDEVIFSKINDSVL